MIWRFSAELELELGDPSTATKQMQQQWILKKAGLLLVIKTRAAFLKMLVDGPRRV